MSPTSGADMVAYSAKNCQYYSASSNFQPGPVIGVIDARTNKLMQRVAITGGSPHSVAVDETNGRVLLAVGTGDAAASRSSHPRPERG